MIVGLLESGCCSCNILESCLQRNEIQLGKKSITECRFLSRVEGNMSRVEVEGEKNGFS